MKKSLLALAVLGAFAGVASAQSSVKLYGTIDVNGRYVKNSDADRRFSLSTDGINSSQLGIKGIEDLGGGLKAGFELLSGINADTGTSNVVVTAGPGTTSSTTSKFWNRRSVVSLYSPLGELRLGRDYRPDFWNMTVFDAFGTNGVGSSINAQQRYSSTRQDNAIGYFLPSNLGGLYGQLMVAAGEGGTSDDRPGRHLGARVGYAAGPLNVALGFGDQQFDRAAAGNLANGKQRTYNVGASWNFGFLKLLGYYNRQNLDTAHEDFGSISAVVPMGQGEVHVGYDRSRLSRDNLPNLTVDQIKLGYVYNLSKRTAMYATASYLSNKDAAGKFIGGGNTVGADPAGKSYGGELGVRHFF